MEFIELLKRIERSKVCYLVVGGIAVNLHGVIRPTNDLDLIVYLEPKNLSKFLKLLTKLGYKPKVPVKAMDFANPKNRRDWIKNKNMIVFSFYHPKDFMKVIDIFVKHPMPFGVMYRRRDLFKVGSIKIPVLSIPDLIKLKKKASRLQDLSDIRALTEVLHIKREKDGQKKKTRL